MISCGCFFLVIRMPFLFAGNDNIFLITNQDNYTLHINMKRFNGVSGEVKYSVFKVDSAYDKYRLTVGGFSSSNDCWGEFCLFKAKISIS